MIPALGYVRSAFDDPQAPGKCSMARVCMLILAVGAAIAMVKGHDIGGAAAALSSVGMSATRAKAGGGADS